MYRVTPDHSNRLAAGIAAAAAEDRADWSDAAIAAEQASLAFQGGRYKLGFAFARIALEAHNQMISSVGYQPPAVSGPAPTPGHPARCSCGECGQAVSATPTFDETAQSAQRALFEPTSENRSLGVPLTARCAAMLTEGDLPPYECHGVITYADGSRNGGAVGWYHLDPSQGTHIPVLPDGVQQPDQG